MKENCMRARKRQSSVIVSPNRQVEEFSITFHIDQAASKANSVDNCPVQGSRGSGWKVVNGGSKDW